MTENHLPVLIDYIERDMLLQPRAELHQDWIEDYAADYLAGAAIPPIVVYRDNAGKHWLADGFHRIFAAEAAGFDTIRADVREGTRRDALFHALSANAVHGHRRTNDDKRRAVDVMLNDPEWAKWSDSEIARACAVGHNMVSVRRRELLPSLPEVKIREPRTVTRGGTTYEMNTGNIGQRETDADAREPLVSAPAFDWEAERIRREAMEPIRALANQPDPETVIAAWNLSRSYGEPVETFHAAIEWLTAFAELYREAEPKRWAKVRNSMEERSHAAE